MGRTAPRDHAQPCSLLGVEKASGTGLPPEAMSRALEKRAEAAGPLGDQGRQWWKRHAPGRTL